MFHFGLFLLLRLAVEKYGRSVGAKLVIQIMFFLIKNKKLVSAAPLGLKCGTHIFRVS
jgi:hypothetical protein